MDFVSSVSGKMCIRDSYDKVESSVRERYEKVQKQQKKTAQKKTVTTKKAR